MRAFGPSVMAGATLTMMGLLFAASEASAASPSHSEITEINTQLPSPEAELGRVSAAMDALGTYVSGDPGSQVLDSAAATAAGISLDMIALGEETVMSQNAHVVALREHKCEPDIASRYPRVAQLNELASDVQDARKRSRTSTLEPAPNVPQGGGVSINTVPGVSPCGEYAHPIPVNAPARVRYNLTSSIETWFGNQGYHPTAAYACGASILGGYNCDTDWTKGTSYTTSTYGTCSAPRFRNQGVETAANSGWVQYGEPNPEVDAYVWPYWNWSAYVSWWHQNH